MKNSPKKMFLSYSHKDEEFKEELDAHLAYLKRLGKLIVWEDRQIQAGMNWDDEIFNELKTADIICLLISQNFINSEFCYSKEMLVAMERRKDGVLVVPIIIKKCGWEKLPFGKLQAVPKNGKPVTLWDDRDSAYHDIVTKIESAI